MPKSSLTNDDLRDDLRAGLLEVETRLETHGLTRQLRRVKVAHALLYDVEGDVHAGGELASRSAPDDKD
jgi:hypothetical protein